MHSRIEKWNRLRAAKPVILKPYQLDAARLIVAPVLFLATNIERLKAEGRGAREAAQFSLNELLAS